MSLTVPARPAGDATGVAIIKPGQSNPRHFHPNCDEILHVLSGKIRHVMNEVTVEMNTDDTMSIP